MPQALKQVFTLRIDLLPPLEFGTTFNGDRRFIPITGGVIEDSDGRVVGEILNGGGDWSVVRSDGVIHLHAKYSIKLEDGTLVNITNEGFGRAATAPVSDIFSDDQAAAPRADQGGAWYIKTWPRFEVAPGKHDWLNKTCFVGDLRPPEKPNHVVVDVYELL
ncbi:uncharacterized protein B0I36DRAFT_321986 [Microdochium trichocladiopsis]|uniref:Uncharacterized protein n=1 Tax=Microdochium trichocladiopsis TaxID=1682393 RepID=A0A9P8YAU0_9PEZI|nr:uncharacterized protein B0I36DRAFT_321986 [Microdochium trichocladiopsis]KAH7033751.1 hypothetical protein B0I36DRAFT_321986 [Microdochium trichocladiopsis]